MQDLIDFADRKDVQQFLHSILGEGEAPGFQGVWVRRHKAFEAITAALKRRKLNSVDEDADPYWRAPPWIDRGAFPYWPSDPTPSLRLDENDWGDAWRDYCARIGAPENREPFIVELRLKPGALNDRRFQQRLEASLPKAPFFTSVEERPIPRLYASTNAPTTSGVAQGKSSPGSSIIEGGAFIRANSGKEGTLGGFFRHRGSSEIFGLTCAHLAQDGETIELWDDASSSWIAIGQCVGASSFATHATCGANCYQQHTAIDVDAALIKLKPGFSGAGTLRGLGAISEIVRGGAIPKRLHVVGGVSGHIEVETNNFGIWNEFTVEPGVCQCFKDLIQLEPAVSRAPVHAKIAALFAKMIQNKDSGSLVLADHAGGGYGACAMAIGGDGHFGYATLLERTQGWARTSKRLLLEAI
ncbi:MAG: hypothetical protein ABL889_01990 [Terricaulis sp.]